ncbi:hypothetical protein [Zavarzinia sp.]|uniref:hypothetical protein n=1 Tax=Zavarzinia sp. TaxID=2027920 RepID=UPI0035682941
MYLRRATPIGECVHGGRRCLACLRRALEVQLTLRRELSTPTGKLARLGATTGGPAAWAATCDDKIALLLCELVTGLPHDSLVIWLRIGKWNKQ